MSSVNPKSEKEEELKSDKTEELPMDISEKEIKEICCMQEQHMNQLKENQKETNELKVKEKQCKTSFNEFEKELELLKESYPNKSKEPKESQMDKKEGDRKKNTCRRNCNESCDNNMCPECKGSKSFINLNPDVRPYTALDMDSQKTNEQREMRVVTTDTEADRARFGRKHVDWN